VATCLAIIIDFFRGPRRSCQPARYIIQIFAEICSSVLRLRELPSDREEKLASCLRYLTSPRLAARSSLPSRFSRFSNSALPSDLAERSVFFEEHVNPSFPCALCVYPSLPAFPFVLSSRGDAPRTPNHFFFFPFESLIIR